MDQHYHPTESIQERHTHSLFIQTVVHCTFSLLFHLIVTNPFIGQARQDKIRQDKIRQDKIRQDKTRQDKTRQDKQDYTRQDKIRHDKTRHDKTRQDKTRQDRTRQDRTRHDKKQKVPSVSVCLCLSLSLSVSVFVCLSDGSTVRAVRACPQEYRVKNIGPFKKL